MTRAELKARAREDLGVKLFGEKWLMALLICLIAELIIGAASFIGGIGTLVVTGPITIGLSAALLTSIRTNKTVDIGEMFTEGFAVDFGRTLLIGFLKNLFIALWSLLFIIPGIVKSYSYAMVEFIAVDHPEYGWKECIDASKEMMNGHKGELFVLDLSFIGWAIVCSFTFGIGYLWLIPYIQMTRAEFYRNLVGDDSYVTVEEAAAV